MPSKEYEKTDDWTIKETITPDSVQPDDVVIRYTHAIIDAETDALDIEDDAEDARHTTKKSEIQARRDLNAERKAKLVEMEVLEE